MSGTKGIRSIQEAVRDHADATVHKVGKSPTSIGRWIANVTAVAIVSTIALASGAVISGEAQAQTYRGGMMKPLQVMNIPSIREESYQPKAAQPQAAQEEAAPSVEIEDMSQEFFQTAVDVIRYNSGMSQKEAAEVLRDMEEAAATSVANGFAKGGRVFNSHGVTLNYNDPANPVLSAYYGPRSLDGRPDLVGKHGAIEKGGKIEIFNGDEHYLVPTKR